MKKNFKFSWEHSYYHPESCAACLSHTYIVLIVELRIWYVYIYIYIYIYIATSVLSVYVSWVLILHCTYYRLVTCNMNMQYKHAIWTGFLIVFKLKELCWFVVLNSTLNWCSLKVHIYSVINFNGTYHQAIWQIGNISITIQSK